MKNGVTGNSAQAYVRWYQMSGVSTVSPGLSLIFPTVTTS